METVKIPSNVAKALKLKAGNQFNKESFNEKYFAFDGLQKFLNDDNWEEFRGVIADLMDEEVIPKNLKKKFKEAKDYYIKSVETYDQAMSDLHSVVKKLNKK